MLVEYSNEKFLCLWLKTKGGRWELLKVEVDNVKPPDEFDLDSGELKQTSGTKDGILKSLSAFSSSNAVKLGKVRPRSGAAPTHPAALATRKPDSKP